jgi:hypothetical protein
MKNPDMLMDKTEVRLRTIRCYCFHDIKCSTICEKRGVKK